MKLSIKKDICTQNSKSFIAASPNTQKDDLKLALSLVLSPFKLIGGKATKGLEKRFAQYFNVPQTFSTNSGRTAIYTALKAIETASKDEVIVQAGTCKAVVNPVMWVDATPVYVDIQDESFNIDTQDLRGKITENTKAIIVQHTFGIPDDITTVKSIIKEAEAKYNHKIYLIEDCAHSLGAKFEDKKIGTFGDISILSFGQDKVISSTHGGLIFSRDQNLTSKIQKLVEDYILPSSFSTLRAILHPIIWNMIKSLYYFPGIPKIYKQPKKFSLGKVIYLTFRTLGFLPKAVDLKSSEIPQPKFRKLSNAQATMCSNQFSKLNRLNNHRRELAKIYTNQLKNISFNKEANYLRYPFLAENPKNLHKALKKHKIIAGNWYNSIVYPKGTNLDLYKYKTGSCPKAEKLTKQIVNLPTNIQTTKDQAKHICNLILNQVDENRKG